MTEEAAFVAAILAAPRDDTPRLVFADWLDERGDPRGELLRIATQLEAIEGTTPPPDMPGRLARVRQIGRLCRRWRELIRPEHRPWLATLHRGPLRCGGVPDGACPGRWDRLPPEAGRPFARHCRTCNRWVRLCWSQQEVEQVQGAGRVIALAVVRTDAEPGALQQTAGAVADSRVQAHRAPAAAELGRSAAEGLRVGMYGSVVIHPVGGRPPGRKRLDAVARDILRAFERAELLPRGTADAAPASPATSVVGCEKLPPGVAGVKLGVDGPAFLPGIADLTFALTWAEYSDGLELELPEGVEPEQFVFPILDVAVYSKSVRATHPDGELACRSWAMIEFSFEDVRVDLDEVHRIRDAEHPLFRALAEALGTEVGWSVVLY